jgi:hypothetical protein
MDDVDQVTSQEDLACCLRQLHILADRPSLRDLETRTKLALGVLPGTDLPRVCLRRTGVSDMLRGRKFPPKKSFFLSFVEACGVNLAEDRRWEQAWNRLAVQYIRQPAERFDEIQRALKAATTRAERAEAENKRLGQKLADQELAARYDAHVRRRGRQELRQKLEAAMTENAQLRKQLRMGGRADELS